jgi:hypothetical protein
LQRDPKPRTRGLPQRYDVTFPVRHKRRMP